MTDNKPNLEYTLKDVRTKFGTLIVDEATVVHYDDYRGKGEKYLINTSAQGIRGPQEEASIDLALTPEQAKTVYEALKPHFER